MDGLQVGTTVSAESFVEELKRYVRFSAADERLLSSLYPHVSPYFERIVTAFYERIHEHDDAHAVFTGEAQIERLHRSLTRWLDALFRGPHDEAYFDKTRKIGLVHVQIGLPQRYMFTAMSLVRTELCRIVTSTLGQNAELSLEALNRMLDLELAVMLESYHEHLAARLHQKGKLERAEVDDALQRLEHRYVSATEVARLMVIGVDRDGLVKLFNREAERVTGYGREQVLNKPFFDFLPPAIREDHEPLLRSYLAKRAMPTELPDLDSAITTCAGRVRDISFQLAYAGGYDEDVVLFALGRDRTEENALEARVRQTEKLAAVGTLAAGLAHEIRNPLNGAQLHVTFLERSLRKKGAEPEQLDAIKVVGEEIKRLSALVTEFLDFARPKPLELQATSIGKACERAAQLVRPVAEKASILLELDLPKNDIVLQLDKPKIDQVLLNLLQNAIEALEPIGGGTIVLRAYRKPRTMVLEVEDDGPGLPSPDAPIFDPFYSSKPNGTGLGLAIAHRIITDHDGTIDVQRVERKTIFRVTLPIRLSTYQTEPDSGSHQP